MPFDIPDNWTWIRLKNTSQLLGGYAFKSEKFSNEGVRVIRISDFDEQGIKDKDIKRYPYSPELNQYQLKENDILMCMTGGTVGKSSLIKCIDEPMYINQRVAMIRIEFINLHYFYYILLSSYIFNVIHENKTSTNDNISMKLIEDFLLPLPPLDEQQRIVDRINLLEPLLQEYDSYEKKAYKLEEEFPEKLKKSILQYAIEGKLVKQDPNDEPASVLLERIKAEKESLIKAGKIKRDKNESYIYQGDDKNYYENLPNNWILTKLKDVLLPMTSRKPQGDNFRYIDIEAVDNKNNVIRKPKLIKTENAPSRASREVKEGDVLFSIVRPYLKNIAIVTKEFSDCVATTGFYVCRPSKIIKTEFLFYYLLSPMCIDSVMPYMKGDNSPSIRGENLEELLIALPSLEIQKKVCTKVNNLLLKINS